MKLDHARDRSRSTSAQSAQLAQVLPFRTMLQNFWLSRVGAASIHPGKATEPYSSCEMSITPALIR